MRAPGSQPFRPQISVDHNPGRWPGQAVGLGYGILRLWRTRKRPIPRQQAGRLLHFTSQVGRPGEASPVERAAAEGNGGAGEGEGGHGDPSRGLGDRAEFVCETSGHDLVSGAAKAAGVEPAVEADVLEFRREQGIAGVNLVEVVAIAVLPERLSGPVVYGKGVVAQAGDAGEVDLDSEGIIAEVEDGIRGEHQRADGAVVGRAEDQRGGRAVAGGRAVHGDIGRRADRSICRDEEGAAGVDRDARGRAQRVGGIGA